MFTDATSVSRINVAVDTCLDRCSSGIVPIELACFVEELRRDPTWSAADVSAVEAAVEKAIEERRQKADHRSPLWAATNLRAAE